MVDFLAHRTVTVLVTYVTPAYVLLVHPTLFLVPTTQYVPVITVVLVSVRIPVSLPVCVGLPVLARVFHSQVLVVIVHSHVCAVKVVTILEYVPPLIKA